MQYCNDSVPLIFDIQRGSYVDGPGIRTTVFFKGCNLNCKWCHNPESKSPKQVRMFFANKCVGCLSCVKACPEKAIDEKLFCDATKCVMCGKCEIVCPESAVKLCGEAFDSEKVFSEIVKDKAFYDSTGGGVTFSGGEAMLAVDSLLPLLKRCAEAGINTAIDTAGNVPFSDFEKVLPYTGLFLFDIKCITPSLHREYVGANNDLIIENYKKLLERSARVFVRVPIIKDVNTGDEFEKIAAFLEAFPPKKIELLPYHAMGENKYTALTGKKPPEFFPPDTELFERMKIRISK